MTQHQARNIAEIDLNGLEALRDPYPLYDQVRREDPVHWNDSDQRWYITRYEDLISILRDQRVSSMRNREVNRVLPKELQQKIKPLTDAMASWMLHSDPPAHTRMRGLVNKAFTPRMIENMRERIQTRVDAILDKVQQNSRMDIIADLAVPLPGIVISDMLGVPEEDQPKFKKWSDDIASRNVYSESDDDIADGFLLAQQSFFELSEYFRDIVKDLRKNPNDNLLSAMVVAEESGDRLTEAELIANCVLLMFAGNETTTNLIGNGMLSLFQNPEQRQMLQADDQLIGSAVEEFLRYDSPVQKTSRIAKEDINIRGKTIASGELISVCYGSANRDPDQFENAEQLDIKRADNRHLSFAQGIHYCLGASLARMEGQVAINSLLRRMPDIKMETTKIDRGQNLTLWGLKSLGVTF